MTRRQLQILLMVALGSALAVGESGVEAPAWVDHPNLAFSITVSEVTVGQYRSCVDSGLCGEETVRDECNYGQPDSEDHPVNCVSHTGAGQYCEAAGGRLCTQDEWLEACRGTDQRAFPYGDKFDLQACNSRSPQTPVAGRNGTVPVGSMEQCEGGLPGLMDMAGNVSEWLSDCKGDYCKFRGGGHMSNEPIDLFAACNAACSGNQKTSRLRTVGIRCCRDTASDPGAYD